ncbi:hypothetical protein [Actinacidiphila glaucinigra]|uniref:Uncharacterized protein n=1 Tax=Actinacidiphila glaucinigra TaxID=235986 RepID=A0A239NC11_9ACTN|nr:hypothetical protein [Actinacidiphila glaucinigra]SNT52033.1 hypothetical protein SAMN05216252_13364 [Actinacidiphila glaucinigra]
MDLGINRAQNIHHNRPRQLAEAVEGLPTAARDHDWKASADLLFRTYSALMLYDVAPDDTEAGDDATNPALGAAEPTRPEQHARRVDTRPPHERTTASAAPT